MTGVLLEANGLTPLDVSLANGYIIQALDLGDADTRVVADDAPDADGTDDTTAFTGARTVTMRVRLVPRNGFIPDLLEQQLRAFTEPALRPIMTITRDGMPDRRAVLRRGPFNAPIDQATHRDVTVQWVAPLGIFESAALHSALIYAGGGATAGRTYPLTFPRTYPASAPLGTGSVFNAGTAKAYPLIRLYGPSTQPEFWNDTQDREFKFASLTVADGTFVEIDTRAKTIRLNGDPGSSLQNKLVFPDSSWWSLSPLVNDLRFVPATYSVGVTVAEVVWRDAYS